MYRLVQFLKKYYTVFLFVLLELIAISYYMSSTSYAKAVMRASSVKMTSGVHGAFASVGDYFGLRRENKILLERLSEVQGELYKIRSAVTDTIGLSAINAPYVFTTAKVISNSIARQDNFFVINKGLRDGVEENMAVLSSNGSVAGFVNKCSDKYAVCVSVLNRDFKIGGQLKHSEYFGSVYWDGTNSRMMTLVDVPRYADVKVGDTLVSAYSLRFPPDTFIGTVASFKESKEGNYYEIKIRLGAPMTALSDVVLVKYDDYAELDALGGGKFADSMAVNVKTDIVK